MLHRGRVQLFPRNARPCSRVRVDAEKAVDVLCAAHVVPGRVLQKPLAAAALVADVVEILCSMIDRSVR